MTEKETNELVDKMIGYLEKKESGGCFSTSGIVSDMKQEAMVMDDYDMELIGVDSRLPLEARKKDMLLDDHILC